MKAIVPRKQTPLPEKKLDLDDRRRLDRKDFSYYMPLIDYDTRELVGHLADISSGGFRMDSLSPIPTNKDIQFHLDLTSEVANKPFMIFVARSKWCKVDPLDPFCYNVGFQLINISPEDVKIFNRLMEKYGKQHQDKPIDLRRSNMW
ncbi:MAG: PilZ domain-containing protein [Anaerolineales bacterium]|nr:PilZ domain-containing protein [Anaerolineales bacterium]